MTDELDEIFAPLIDSPSLTLTTTYWNEAKQAIQALIDRKVEEALQKVLDTCGNMGGDIAYYDVEDMITELKETQK